MLLFLKNKFLFDKTIKLSEKISLISKLIFTCKILLSRKPNSAVPNLEDVAYIILTLSLILNDQKKQLIRKTIKDIICKKKTIFVLNR